MKYAMIGTRGDSKWVCAIYNSREQTNGYQSAIPSSINSYVVEIEADSYPIFIFEKDEEFEFTDDIDVVVNRIRSTKKIEGFKDSYFTYYTVDKLFFAAPYGFSVMGSIPRVWVDNECIDEFNSLLEERE